MPHEMGGADEKARIERMCISLHMSKNLFNSKVIKSFVPELRSRKCFSNFEIPMFYVIYIYIYMYILHQYSNVRFTHDVYYGYGTYQPL